MNKGGDWLEVTVGLGPNWGWNPGLPYPSHEPHLRYIILLAEEAISFSLQAWKMLGGPREEARSHSLRNSGSCLELEEAKLSGGG